MIYGPDDITCIDPLDYIQRTPRMFFRGGAHDPTEVATRLVGEALDAGAQDVRVAVQSDWLVVTADRDWIGALEPSVFHRIVPIPGQPTSMFAEILLTVFAQRVVTATTNHTTVIKGNDTTQLDFPRTWARMIAFDRTRNEDAGVEEHPREIRR